MNDVPWWAWMWGVVGGIALAYIAMYWAYGGPGDWPDDY
jgi:hypothetical protein